MKSLQHKVIIYDDVCPMCKAYTNGFVALGWIMPDNRLGFSAAPQELLANIDLDRARHEIPLYDMASGQTLYGKDALFYILGEVCPPLRPLFKWSLFRAVVFGLYQLITYNRRVIAGSKNPAAGFDCAPDFNSFYRWLYIVLSAFAALALCMGLSVDSIQRASLVALGLLTAVGVLCGFLIRPYQQRTTYYGHLATVLLVAALGMRLWGLNACSIVIVPALAVHFFTRRIIN